MAAIPCPDCLNTVSEHAAACPYCARPFPGKPIEAVYREQQKTAAAVANEQARLTTEAQANYNNEIFGTIWLMHAVIVWAVLGFGKAFFALFIGPFIWFFR
ncbi:MAG: hypothetical protein ABI414_09210 [Devosia sp.]